MTENLVIVESPTKAKTLGKYLGSDYEVIASYGHVRDLPSKSGSVDPENDFAMHWDVTKEAKKHIEKIIKDLHGKKKLILATDPDREGEAIAWHIRELLQDKKMLKNCTVERVAFHEVTKTAVKEAIAHPRNIDQNLISAYLARRALDYLFGFTLSPILWRKLPGARSAGRVQSVALRLIVEREEEIEVFKPQEYWDVWTKVSSDQKNTFDAKLTVLDGKKLEKFSIPTKAAADDAQQKIENGAFAVSAIDKKTINRNPYPPFITSTLQQDAARKLGFTASKTMKTAQSLYEGVNLGKEISGLITYMRTDSVHVAQEALNDMRQYIDKHFDKTYLPSAARAYKSKVKNAQEAHEAIRPTQMQLTPKKIASALTADQLALYDLIWRRALASQMASAQFEQNSIDMHTKDKQIVLHAVHTQLMFDGFLTIYRGEEEESEDTKALPRLDIGTPVQVHDIKCDQHFTQPPPRYSEATLVKKLEELGIGRPSTYASLIETLKLRNYVRLDARRFMPEIKGRIVVNFLMHYFAQYVEYDFTANLEQQLDEISSGNESWTEALTVFWKSLKTDVGTMDAIKVSDVITSLEQQMTDYLFAQMESRACPKCGTGQINLKLSQYGAFLGCSRYPDCPFTQSLDGGTVKIEAEPTEIGADPATDQKITLRKGPYGYYLQWDPPRAPEAAAEDGAKPKRKRKTPAKPKKPKAERVSIPKFMDPLTVTLKHALFLKSLPAHLGQYQSMDVYVGLGRFGPYLKYGDKFVSIPKALDLFEITLSQAQEVIQKKMDKPENSKIKKLS